MDITAVANEYELNRLRVFATSRECLGECVPRLGFYIRYDKSLMKLMNQGGQCYSCFKVSLMVSIERAQRKRGGPIIGRSSGTTQFAEI